MGKINYTKTVEQLAKLELFFTTHRRRYSSKEIKELALQIGLSRQRVYKWLWDRRRIQRRKVKIQEKDTPIKQTVPMVVVNYDNYHLKIPENKQQAIRFDVNTAVSPWAQKMLYEHGWQLVRDLPVNNPTFTPNQPIQHVQSFAYVTKEEVSQDYEYKMEKTVKKPTRVQRKLKNDQEITPKKTKKRVTWDLQGPQVQVQKEEQSIYFSD